jgi:hypothetical protein
LEAIAVGLAAKAIQVITPYVKKGFEKFAGDVGEAAAKKVKGLFDTIKKRLAGDNFASETLERFEKEPEEYKNYAQKVIKEKIESDKNFEKELDGLLKEIPVVEIIQKVKIVEGKQIGFKAKKVKGGKVTVTQESDKITKEGSSTAFETDEFG